MAIWQIALWGIGAVLVVRYFLRMRGQGSRIQALWAQATRAYEGGDYHTAITGFDAAVRMSPTFAPARRMRGRTYMQLGEYAHAEEDFRMAAALEPRNAEGYIDLGFFLATCPPPREDEAIDAFESAVAYAPRMRNDLAQAPQLAHLRNHPRFAALVDDAVSPED